MKTLKAIIIVFKILGIPLQVNATTYIDAQNAEVPVVVNIIAPEEIIIPPINPENPVPPIDPIKPELEGNLSLLYVSSLDFGEIKFKLNESQLINARLDSGDVNGEEVSFDNMVSLMDIRGSRGDGWNLRVSQMDELFEGATITMYPKINENAFGISSPHETIVLNKSSTIFASANGLGEAGVISMGMGNVTLAIPPSTGVGEYKTTLNWQLILEP